MKLSTLLALPAYLASVVYASAEASEYKEHLLLKPLPGRALYAGFSFNATTPLSAYDSQHFRYFPRSLGQILQYTHTAELHLRFSLGRWDEESWGSRPRSGAREGGNGVELWAWLEGSADATADARWSDLVNSLSGLFCASLNFIDSGKTVRPLLSFEPEGTLDELQAAQRKMTGEEQGKLQLLHGMLPHEVVCTENLTPFLKLLPCKGKAGISSLLDGHKVFDANWQTMSIDVRPICTDSGECELEIQQTVDMVLDIERSMRPRDDPIPRPPPIEEIVCDETKVFNAHDTCYPKPFDGEMEWSLTRIFGRPIRGSCPLSGDEGYDLAIEVPPGRTVQAASEHYYPEDPSGDGNLRLYHIPEEQNFDVMLPKEEIEEQISLAQPPLIASRQMTGSGQERGGMHTVLQNLRPYPQRIVYLESLPWFLRPYIHTLHVDGGEIEKMYYTPLLDRERGTHLELLIEIPAESTVELTYDFEKAILRYTEYPPDANRGFDVPAAIIRVLPFIRGGKQVGQGEYLRTTSLLLPLPTPDFSMPYNVIILTSTVIALGFGSIFNLVVRRFVLIDEVPPQPLAEKIKRGVGLVREQIVKLKTRNVGDAGKANDGVKVTSEAKEYVKSANGRPKGQSKKDR